MPEAHHAPDLDPFDLASLPAPGPEDTPIRWDALSFEPTAGYPEPAEDPFFDSALDENGFAPGGFVAGAYDPARDDGATADPFGFDAVSEPAVAAEPLLVPLDEGGSEPTLYDDAVKVCVRLTGITSLAHELASRAVRAPEEAGAPSGTVDAVIAAAVRESLAADIPADVDVPYAQHRARLRRELARHDERRQTILALRHLVAVPPMAVAARLGIHESQVREVTSAWRPADSRGDSSALLRGIDSWISSDLGEHDREPAGGELAHLDDAVD